MTRARKTDEDAGADDWNGFGIENFTTQEGIGSILDYTKNSRSNVTGIYNRYTYDDEKRDALNLWGARLEDMIAGCPVR